MQLSIEIRYSQKCDIKLLNYKRIASQEKLCVSCSRGNSQKSSVSRWWMKSAVDIPVFYIEWKSANTSLSSTCWESPSVSQSFPLLRLPAAVPCGYFDTLQIIWLSFKQPSKWALMCFSELLSIALLVSRPLRLLRVDSLLTQRAIHPSSEQNVTFVALQPFKKPQTCQKKADYDYGHLLCAHL